LANIVNNQIKIFPSKKEGVDKIEALFQRLTNRQHKNMEWWFADLFVSNDENSPTYEQVAHAHWNNEHIGSKWAWIVDYHLSAKGHATLSITSAWDSIDLGAEKLTEEIANADAGVVVIHTYDDEAPNFWGISIREGTECSGEREDDEDDIMHFFFERHPNLKSVWDDDEDDWMRDENGEYTADAEAAQHLYEQDVWVMIESQQDALIDELLPDWCET
jgi:hypothetical protein